MCMGFSFSCLCQKIWMKNRFLPLLHLEKDVDGFHPINIGRLAQKGREPLAFPAHLRELFTY